MNDMQKILFGMMEIIHKICSKEGIRYYMIGGTLLGAVRHKGFIPWDDDMDIGMPREDFDRFLSLASDSLPEWAELIRPGGSQERCNYGFAKFVNKNTTFVEQQDGVERVGGIYIDIFPLDGLGNNEWKAKLRFIKARYKFLLLKLNQGNTHKGKNSVDYFLRKLLLRYSRLLGEKVIYKSLVTYVGKYDFYSSGYAANVFGAWAMKEFLDTKLFGDPRLYQFESREFYGVEEGDEYLRRVYGDYMQLPPPEKRLPHHGTICLTDVPYTDYEKNRNEYVRMRD